MTIRRWIPRLIALAIVAGGAAALIITKPWSSGPTPITFTTVAIGKGTIAAQVTANGALSARGTVTVGAQVSGRVVELYVDFNDKVTKGQVIAKLDEQVLKAQIDQQAAASALAAANVSKSQVALDDAQRQLARQKSLQDQQLVAGVTVEAAQVAFDTARAALAASRAQAAQASANLSQARLNLTYATIVSPVNGVVLSRAVDKGQTVAATMSAPTLFTIAEDLALMQIDTAVSESDVGRLTDKMKAQFTVDAFRDRTFDGVVRQVRNAPTTTAGVVTYDAVIDVENQDKLLRPGMTASVTFVLASVADAIKIPNAALRWKPTREQLAAIYAQLGGGPGSGSGSGSGGLDPGRRSHGSGTDGSTGSPQGDGSGGRRKPEPGDRKAVFKLVDGAPRRVMVKLGLTDGSSTQLLEGDLQPGDLLITEVQGVPATGGRKMGPF